MTDDTRFLDLLTRISPNRPIDIDPLLFGATEVPTTGHVAQAMGHPPPATLWQRDEFGRSFIGIRMRTPVEAADALATAVTAAAVERQIIPIFLSWDGACDMQRFGFRVEYITGADEDACTAMETEVARFWNLAIIVDAEAVSALS